MCLRCAARVKRSRFLAHCRSDFARRRRRQHLPGQRQFPGSSIPSARTLKGSLACARHDRAAICRRSSHAGASFPDFCRDIQPRRQRPFFWRSISTSSSTFLAGSSSLRFTGSGEKQEKRGAGASSSGSRSRSAWCDANEMARGTTTAPSTTGRAAAAPVRSGRL